MTAVKIPALHVSSLTFAELDCYRKGETFKLEDPLCQALTIAGPLLIIDEQSGGQYILCEVLAIAPEDSTDTRTLTLRRVHT